MRQLFRKQTCSEQKHKYIYFCVKSKVTARASLGQSPQHPSAEFHKRTCLGRSCRTTQLISRRSCPPTPEHSTGPVGQEPGAEFPASSEAWQPQPPKPLPLKTAAADVRTSGRPALTLKFWEPGRQDNRNVNGMRGWRATWTTATKVQHILAKQSLYMNPVWHFQN